MPGIKERLSRLFSHRAARSEASAPDWRVLAFAVSDVGCERNDNQDRVRVVTLHEPGEHASMVCLVADGMGGAAGGGLAAQTAIDSVVNCLTEAGTAQACAALKRAVAQSNTEIFERARANDHLTGMGTTLSVLWLVGRRVFCAHVGDSRIYRIREGRIEQISHDHSYVAEMLRTGLIDEAQARQHPDQNVLTRALGTHAQIDGDVWEVEGGARLGDQYLLCSDGLHGLVDDEHLLSLAAMESVESACQALIEQARAKGGGDNISVCLLNLAPALASTPRALRETRPQLPVTLDQFS